MVLFFRLSFVLIDRVFILEYFNSFLAPRYTSMTKN
jgi:hypothetical protein